MTLSENALDVENSLFRGVRVKPPEPHCSSSILAAIKLSCELGNSYTGGIEKFSSKGNFRKILKVSHFYLKIL